MTPHDHRVHVPGCYRCELGSIELAIGLAEERDELTELLSRVYDQAVRNSGYVSSGLLNEIHGLVGEEPALEGRTSQA